MPSSHAVPVFHPDHPHNKPSHLFASAHPDRSFQPLASAHPNIPRRQASLNKHHNNSNTFTKDEMMSDSDASSASSPCQARRKCFCGREIMQSGGGDGGIYCSIDCARSDAFSSLCYKSAPTPKPSESLSLASSISSALSRTASSSSASTSTSASALDGPSSWEASHYRRLARADLRRDERREERKRRRAEGSVASAASRSTVLSSTSSSASRVPDLVGGYQAHSRNPSVVSTASSTSAWSSSTLSRNPSSASSVSQSSRRGFGGANVNASVNVDAVIMEADDEEEWLTTTGSVEIHPYAMSAARKQKRRPSHSIKRKAEAMASGKGTGIGIGMSQDMRDVLEEIIQMEKVFMVDDQEPDIDQDQKSNGGVPIVVSTPQTLAAGAMPTRAPRTPSPTSPEKRMSGILQVPGAPVRGHRSTLSNPHASPRSGVPQRPPSMIGLHQASLSESHTALYLATASPVQSTRRSVSPQLQVRKSLTFTPEAAGPSILGLPVLPIARNDSPGGSLTPSRRRMNFSANHHPTMDNWRFPSTTSGYTSTSNGAPTMVTPTRRPTPIITQPLLSTEKPQSQPEARIPPHLLWPPPPNLQPSLFPISPMVETPEIFRPRMRNGSGNRTSPTGGVSPETMLPPNSGMRLGVLLGSGEDEGMDVDGDDEDGSTVHGHGGGGGGGAEDAAYLPVFLEAEGFRPTYRTW